MGCWLCRGLGRRLRGAIRDLRAEVVSMSDWDDLSAARDLWLPGLRQVADRTGVKMDLERAGNKLWLKKDGESTRVSVFERGEAKPSWPEMRLRFEAAASVLK